MKIVFVNPWDRWIGPNRFLLDMLREARHLVPSATIVFHEQNNAIEDYLQLGCNVVIWPEIAPIHPRPNLKTAISFYRVHTIGLLRVLARLRRLRPDCVVTNSETVWVGAIASRFLRLRHFQIFHAITFEYRLKHWPRLLFFYLRWIAMWSFRLIGVSQTLATALIQHGVPASKVVVVPNPIAPPSGDGDKIPEVKGSPVVLSAGRISPIKGQDLLIEALPLVHRRFPEFVCLFAGQIGSNTGVEQTEIYYQQLCRRVAELGLEQRVQFLGEVENLDSWLKAADLYVQPSRSESFGRVVVQSLLCETPVVAFAAGALPETLNGGAVFVPTGDVTALAEAIIKVLENPEETRERTEKGKAEVAERFSAERVARQFEAVLRT